MREWVPLLPREPTSACLVEASPPTASAEPLRNRTLSSQTGSRGQIAHARACAPHTALVSATARNGANHVRRAGQHPVRRPRLHRAHAPLCLPHARKVSGSRCDGPLHALPHYTPLRPRRSNELGFSDIDSHVSCMRAIELLCRFRASCGLFSAPVSGVRPRRLCDASDEWSLDQTHRGDASGSGCPT